MGIDKKIGRLKKGKLNLITDVKGIKIGHKTLANGNIQTGVTAIIPTENNIFKEKFLCASHIINGFGKSVGLVQVDELGTLETPIILTNTLSVGTALTALVKYMLKNNPEIGESTSTVNPLVLECNDMRLNDIRALNVKEEDVFDAIKDADSIFEEGAVGAGRGMKCYELKGGIGSSSRVFEIDGKEYTLGSLVMTNHGKYNELVIDGEYFSDKYPHKVLNEKDKGSVITILATDAPLSSRQLKRLAKRAVAGLCRNGSYISNGSGEIVIAFSTANIIKHDSNKILNLKSISDDTIDLLFTAVGDSVCESVLSSLYHAETVVGKNGFTVYSIKDVIKKNL